jgi:hypothetical protein
MDRQQIPIYRGSERGIISPAVEEGWYGHGKDGLGDSILLTRDHIQSPE